MNTSPPATPCAVLIVGWTGAFTSILMIVMNIFSLVSSSAMEEMLLSPNLLGTHVPPSLHAVLEVYQYSRYWLLYGIVFFSFVLIAALQFLRLKAWGRRTLEALCWIGLLNAFADSAFSYYSWIVTRDAMGDVMGRHGSGLSGMDQLGILAIALGFILWVIPCLGLLVFLRRSSVRQAVNV